MSNAQPCPRAELGTPCSFRALDSVFRGASAWHVLSTFDFAEANMGRALEAVRTRRLEGLFRYFGIDVQPQLVAAHRDAIAERFGAEVQEILRLCSRLREKERFTIVREALRLSYESTVGR